MKDELVIFKVSSFDRSELNRHVVNVVKRSQRGFRVVIGDDDNLETTLSPVPQMTPLKVRCHLCTDDNVVSKLSSTVKNVFSKVSSFWGCKRVYAVSYTHLTLPTKVTV